MKTIRKPGLTKLCARCGVVFPRKLDVTYKQWEKASFCSRECHLRSSGPSGAAHYKWRGGKASKSCEQCGGGFTVRPYRTTTARFCSYPCKVKAQDNGLSTENEKQRHSTKYKAWRLAVFQRDNFTCQSCSKRGGVLNADHIQPFALFPELRFDLTNGRTLCRPCHLATPTHGFASHVSRHKNIVALTKGF